MADNAAAAPAAAAPTPEERLRAAAAREGDAASAEVAALLFSGVNANAADADGTTALHEAAGAGNMAVAMLLLSRGADVAAATRNCGGNNQPLHYAAFRGHAAMVSLLLAHGADASAADGEGHTPLYTAFEWGRLDAVRAFLDAGVPVNARCSSYGSTALHEADSMHAFGDLVPLLLERGASVHALDDYGNTPLHLLITFDGNPQTLELLLAAGADVNAATKDGTTPLRALAMKEAGHGPAMLKRAIAAGARLEVADTFGRTPLQYAARQRNLGAVKELLRGGANVNVRDDLNGATALHYACKAQYGQKDVVVGVIKALLDAGADAGIVDQEGRQPLHWLALAGFLHQGEEQMEAERRQAGVAVARLKSAGADLDAVDAGGNTPLMLALSHRSTDSPVLQALVLHGARAGPPECAACADMDAKRTALQSLAVVAAAEVTRLRHEREAWREQQAALEAERAALEAAARAAAAVEAEQQGGKGGGKRRRSGGDGSP